MGILDPNVTQAKSTLNETVSQSLPSFITQHQQDVLNLGKQGAAEAGVAGLSTDEQAAVQQARANTGNWVPGLSGAMNLVSGAAGPASAGISNYQNPFQKQVVDETQRLAEQNWQRRIAPGLAGAAIGSGGIGSQRLGQAYGEASRDWAGDLAGKIGGLNMAGWDKALAASQSDLNRQLQAGQALGNQAGQAQAYGQQDVQNLLGVGGLQRGIQQQNLDFVNQQAKLQGDLLQGIKAPITTSTSRESTQPITSNSDFERGLGVFSGLDRLTGGSLSNSAAGFAKNLFGTGGGGGGGSYANPFTGGYTGNYDTNFSDGGWDTSDAWVNGWGDWKDGGRVPKMADGGSVMPNNITNGQLVPQQQQGMAGGLPAQMSEEQKLELLRQLIQQQGPNIPQAPNMQPTNPLLQGAR